MIYFGVRLLDGFGKTRSLLLHKIWEIERRTGSYGMQYGELKLSGWRAARSIAPEEVRLRDWSS